MKPLISLMLITLWSAALAEDEVESHFYRTFNKLHQEPPSRASSDIARFFDVKTNWITQKLDHFDEKNNRTWLMRFLSNGKHFKPGGPIFISVGGEWAVSRVRLLEGHMFDMAKNHSGYMFYTEHRYYGKSQPSENLKYLDVKQALFDLNHLISTVKSKIEGLESARVVLVGGSYAGSIVTWFQVMFPGVVAGSWASSAPLLAKLDLSEYMERAGKSIKQIGGEGCYDRIENAVGKLEEMFSNGRADEVEALFKICKSFDPNNDLDIYTFFNGISDIFSGVVVYHSGTSIQEVCEQIMTYEDDVQGLASYVLNQTIGKDDCVDFSYKSLLKSVSYSSKGRNMLHHWFYQTCNEFGWYQTSGSKLQPFGTKFPLNFFTNICRDVYHNNFTNAAIQNKIEKTNMLFGALNPGTENVYFTQGQLDPWRSVGLQEIGKATMIPGYSHCKDFESISKEDSVEMKASKEAVAELVRKWVGDQ